MTEEHGKNGTGLEPESDDRIEAILDSLTIEKAPASLTQRLYRIPGEESRGSGFLARLFKAEKGPRWLAAPAFATLAVAALLLVLLQPRQPDPADVEQARQDLRVAFAYIDKAGLRTGHEIQSILGSELRHTVKGNLSRHIPYTTQSLEEETI
jgi:hypothetical protein